MIRGIPDDPIVLPDPPPPYEDRKVAFVRISLEMLHAVLKFPENSRIVAFRDEGKSDELTMRVEGDGLPERYRAAPGGSIAYAKPQYKIEFPSNQITLESF